MGATLPIQTIWKFEIPVDDEVFVEMPRHAVILAVAPQHGRIFAWARVQPEATRIQRRFEVVGTGNPCEHVRGKHIGTVQATWGPPDGPLMVWHVFDAGESALPISEGQKP